ncbi:hypothetical protein QKW52_02085 [Bacillus sonorensis]|nr:hypothetical protein [Bacillus sonorensis]
MQPEGRPLKKSNALSGHLSGYGVIKVKDAINPNGCVVKTAQFEKTNEEALPPGSAFLTAYFFGKLCDLAVNDNIKQVIVRGFFKIDHGFL